MSLLVCPYCRGGKFNRHDKPAEISAEFWDRQCGPLNLCLLCKGHGKIGQGLFNESGETGVVFLKTVTTPPKVLVSCPAKGCRKWADATPFFSPGPEARLSTVRCPDGHAMELEVTT